MAGRFWRLQAPPYESDYEYIFVNGGARHPLSLPGISCGVCKQKWGGGRILAVSCPPALRELRELQEHWPIPHQQHRDLRERVLATLLAEGHGLDRVGPGDSFQPAYLSFASRPRYDFLWVTLGAVVVGERVKQLFEQHQVTGVLLCSAVIEAVGKHEPSDEVPMPSTGEPEDILEEVEKEGEPERFGPLYEMLITAESGRPPGSEIIAHCEGCGRAQFERARRQLILKESMVPASDVFFLGTTLRIIVGEKVHDLVLNNGLTNVQMTEVELVIGDGRATP